MNYFRFIRQQYPILSFALILTFAGSFGQTFFISLYGGAIRETFALTNTTYGLYYSCATLLSSLVLVKAGALIDRYPMRNLAYVTCGMLMVAALAMAAVNNVWVLGLAFFLLRFSGQAFMTQLAFTNMAKFYHRNRGKALSIASFGMPLGEAVLPSLAVLLMVWVGWRWSWVLVAISIPVLFMPALFMLGRKFESVPAKEQVQSDKARSKDKELKHWTRKRVLLDYRFLISVPAIVSPAFIITGLFFHQVYIVTEKGWVLTEFAGGFLMYGLAHFLGSLITGPWLDHFGVRGLLSTYLLPFVLGLAVFGFLDEIWAAPVFFFLAGLTVGSSSTVVGSLLPEVYGTKHLGAIRSMLTALVVFSTAVSPILFGWVLDAGFSVNGLLLGCALYAFISAVVNAVTYTNELRSR